MEGNQTSQLNLILPGSILLAALIIGGAVLARGGGDGAGERTRAQLAGDAPITAEEEENVPTADDDVVLGSADAPVTFITFTDYQCPYCKQLFDAVEGKLREAYIATGKVRMVARDFPLDTPDAYGNILHPFARAAAEAAQCAADQGKYWLYHDALFSRQAQIPTMDFTALAGELGLDQNVFRACVESRKYKDEVQKDFDDGVAAGVRGTPGNFVNGRPLHGMRPYEEFIQVIEEELVKAGQ